MQLYLHPTPRAEIRLTEYVSSSTDSVLVNYSSGRVWNIKTVLILGMNDQFSITIIPIRRVQGCPGHIIKVSFGQPFHACLGCFSDGVFRGCGKTSNGSALLLDYAGVI